MGLDSQGVVRLAAYHGTWQSPLAASLPCGGEDSDLRPRRWLLPSAAGEEYYPVPDWD